MSEQNWILFINTVPRENLSRNLLNQNRLYQDLLDEKFVCHNLLGQNVSKCWLVNLTNWSKIWSNWASNWSKIGELLLIIQFDYHFLVFVLIKKLQYLGLGVFVVPGVHNFFQLIRCEPGISERFLEIPFWERFYIQIFERKFLFLPILSLIESKKLNFKISENMKSRRESQNCSNFLQKTLYMKTDLSEFLFVFSKKSAKMREELSEFLGFF